MQVLIAYAFEHADEDVATRLGRVADHYDQLWRVPVARHGRDGDRIGLHVWDATVSPWCWPAWQEDSELAVATVRLPLGHERAIGEQPPERAALALGRALLDRPDTVAELTGPFVMGALETKARRVTLITDAIGFGRLYQLRFAGGWVWSNRPAAACLFAGVHAESDALGWRHYAATGRFMGRSTPFENVYAVTAATQVGYDASGPGRVERHVDVLDTWATGRGDGLAAERVDEVADALQGLARSVSRDWSGGIAVELTGGRDSRLVAAAFLSEGVEVHLYTDAAEPGEAVVAQQLVAALPRPVTHIVDIGSWAAPGERPATLERALAWHRNQEGSHLATFLPARPPDGLRDPIDLSIGGVAGEVARGYYYPKRFAELDALPGTAARFDAFLEHLPTKLIRSHGVSSEARHAALSQVRRVLLDAAAIGLDDAKMLDYFFVAERLHRLGGPTSEGGVVSPLLAPEFMRAAFDLTPGEARTDALHTALVARLMPAWTDMPFYKRPPGEVQPAWQPRLGSAPDRDLISSIVANPDQWGDGYDIEFIQQAWRTLRTGDALKRAEVMLQRVIWRAVFNDYLAELNGEKPQPRSAEGAAPPRIRRHRARKLTARALRKAARVVEPV